MLVTQTSFCEGSSGDFVKHPLFSQAVRHASYTTMTRAMHCPVSDCYFQQWLLIITFFLVLLPGLTLESHSSLRRLLDSIDSQLKEFQVNLQAPR